ncbi:hypothetical protein BDY19DRAFT_717752 [Irpex rosettiformis]|uniref:Uncharacterized protein n=1 Tax=Irpex rosettiformis TaxID=378272 RepID=A0ACB8U9C9_9APHY|nr:hypothetical protein BDY19DRAFT_717752 [Irpex rosettiformis]
MPPKTTHKNASQSKGAASKSKKKAPPKQPLSTSERLRRLFNSLCAQIDGGHFSNAIKTCDKILRLEPQDKDALQTKLFLLLQTEQYSAALTLIDSKDEYAFEKAYSLYRSNQASEAKEALELTKQQKGQDERGIIHLEAQLYYREGSYQVAFELYSQLLDTSEPSSDEHADILTNLEAAQKHLDFINTGYLHALDSLPSVTASALETAPPPQPATAIAAISIASATEVVPTQREKKLRTKRLPKSVVLGVTPPPDPERWVKKSERSTFGQGGKRRKGAGGGATQGIVESPSASQSAGQGTKSSSKSKKKK